MKKIFSLVLIVWLTACTLPSAAPTASPLPSATAPPTETFTPTPQPSPTETPTPTETPAPTATLTETPTPIPVVDKLEAVVVADLLSCRYGPGAEYLYFYGFKKGMKLSIIGRAKGNNWVMVDGMQHLCWVNSKFIEIQGDKNTLKVTYPDGYRLPVSPYYPSPVILNTRRNGATVTIDWNAMTLRPGDEEDENMFIYLIEVWRCQSGEIVFETLATNEPTISFVDEGGCEEPSRARVFFQEKHGFAGPAEAPLP